MELRWKEGWLSHSKNGFSKFWTKWMLLSCWHYTGCQDPSCAETRGYCLQFLESKGWERKREIGQKVEFRRGFQFKLCPLPYRLTPLEYSNMQTLAIDVSVRRIVDLMVFFFGFAWGTACLVYAFVFSMVADSMLGAFCFCVLAVIVTRLVIKSNGSKMVRWLVVHHQPLACCREE